MIKFKEVAHLYLGCKIQTEEGIGTLDEVSTENIFIVSYDLVDSTLAHDKYKPLLRPISDVMEYEKKEAYELFFNSVTSQIGAANKTKYLLSKHFDLFNLIENGEAIDITTINSNDENITNDTK